MIYTLYRLVCKDISNGLERIPVPASNTVDDPPLPPVGKCICNLFHKFSYMSSSLHHITIHHEVVGALCMELTHSTRIPKFSASPFKSYVFRLDLIPRCSLVHDT